MIQGMRTGDLDDHHREHPQQRHSGLKIPGLERLAQALKQLLRGGQGGGHGFSLSLLLASVGTGNRGSETGLQHAPVALALADPEAEFATADVRLVAQDSQCFRLGVNVVRNVRVQG